MSDIINSGRNDSRENDRERLLRRVRLYGFMTDDLRLYLDTHPDSQDALNALKNYLALKKAAKEQYEERYGLLTLEGAQNQCAYRWTDGPWPWQAEV